MARVSDRVVRRLGRWGCDGGRVNPSIQCSRLGVKIVAARVCLWCFRVSIRVSNWGLVLVARVSYLRFKESFEMAKVWGVNRISLDIWIRV